LYDLVSDKLKSRAHEMGFEKYLYEKEAKAKQGGELELNRKIVRTKEVQILLDPVSYTKEFDTAVAQMARDNNVAIAFSLSKLLEMNGLKQVIYLRNLKEAVKITQRKKAVIIICTNAKNEHQLRTPELLIAFGQLIGLTKQQARWSLNQAYEGII